MGKRKSAAKPPPKKRMDKLDTVFSCPFCNHGSSVECRIDMKNLIGKANYRICKENFSTTVNGLGFCMKDLMNEADKVYQSILDRKWNPDGSVYSILIHGHCRGGNVTKALSFSAMWICC